MLKLFFIPFLLLALVGCNVSNSFKDPAPDPNAFQITDFNPGNNSLLVRWSLSLDAISYSVHYREINNTSFTTAASGVSNPYIVTGLINGSSYVVKVKAVSSLGKETFSNEITTTVGPGTSAPVTADFSAPPMIENAQSIITLAYADVDGDLGTSCTISSLSNVTVTTACVCDGAGVCTVGVTGNLNYFGSASFGFSVTAGAQISNISTASMNIGSVDSPPVANNITPAALTEDIQSILTLSYSDIEGNTASSCALSSLTNVTITQACACSGAGVCTVGVRGTANFNGAASFDYSVIANSASSNLASASFTINAVDDAPVSSNITPGAMSEDIQSIIPLSYLDTEGHLASACSISSLTNVTVTQACSCDGLGNCTVGVTGSLNYFGTASFAYTVTANTLTSNSAAASLVVNPVNDVPVANNISPAAMSEDVQSIITLSYSDIDSDLASACAVTSVSNVTVTQACACNGSGVCTVGVTGTLNYNGAANFTYTVTANTQTSAAATATLAINAGDDAPVASAITPGSFNEDTQSIMTLSYTDTESHLAAACTISSPTNVTVTQACACDGAGTCTVGVTGTSNYNGAGSFSYTVTANGLVSNSASSTFTIDAVNDVPVASNITPPAFNEDTQSIITLSYTDTESSLATACTISLESNVTVTQACACDGSGVCTVGVTGTANYNGAGGFSYMVTAGAQNSAAATATLSITSVDDAPVAVAITPAAFNEDTQSIITLSYTDVESHPATACTISAPTNVTVTQACACVTGTCTVGVTGTSHYNGAASFSYTVTANTLTSPAVAATLTINAVADVPVANNFTPATFNEDTQSVITLSYTDGDADLATACAISSLSNVTVTQACACAAGVCTVGVTGTLNYNGSGSFDFTVTANAQTSAAGTASLTIANVDDAPVAAAITPVDFLAGTQSIITLSYSDVDSNLATACTTSALNNVSVTQACACNGSGVCTVGVTGSAGIIDPGSFSYTVTANAAVSNTVSASFNLICPTGYIEIPANAGLGVSGFCSMKYEARDNGLSVAVSTSTGSPWASINQNNARLECTSLGTKYDLISNPEWITIARNIENEPSNWSSGIVGTGNLNRGHTDAAPNNALSITNTADPYDSTGNSAVSGWEQKRTHTLSNSNEIWDFSGNLFEWVDWTLTAGLQTVTPANKAYGNPPDTAPVDGWREFTVLNTNIGATDEMKPETWQASNASFSTSEGIGAYNSGDNTSGGTAHRGGNWNFGANAGIFSLSLTPSPGVQSIGFRCVYRP